MKPLSVIKRGYSSLRNGDVWRIVRWVWLRNNTPFVVDDWEPPSWIETENDVAVSRIGDQYVMGIQNNPSSLTVVFPEPVSTIEFELFDVDTVEQLTTTATFQTVTGETISRSTKVADGSWNDLKTLPLQFSASEPSVSVTIEFEAEYADEATTTKWVTGLLDGITDRIHMKPRDSPQFGVPRPRSESPDQKPPIFLISVDTLRHDHLHLLSDLIDELGPDVTVPSEPRTQGHWTPASHASMLTGTHPGDHQYVGWTNEGTDLPIDPDHRTMAELLSEQGYKCSGLVSHGRLLPEAGFGRGFHRYEFQNMDSWLERDTDGTDIYQRLSKWLATDTQSGTGGLFYFAHFFDPHYPYVPPLPKDGIDLDLEAIDAFRDAKNSGSYLDPDRTDVPMEDDDLTLIKTYYQESIKYVEMLLMKLIGDLKRHGLFDDALIIITGDHGEEFFEQGVGGHDTLHDANIRQGMIVKPPAQTDLAVPETPDLIDMLPTVARLVGAEVPAQCRGVPWQDSEAGTQPRITERIRPDWYSIAVEEGDTKGIFTYESNFPYRPDETMLSDEPVEARFHRLSAVRNYDTDKMGVVDAAEQDRLAELAEAFFDQSTATDDESDRREHTISPDTSAQLKQLGYK